MSIEQLFNMSTVLSHCTLRTTTPFTDTFVDEQLHRAVVSVMLLTIALFICQLRRNFDDCRPSAKEHPRWQVNRVQIRAIRW